MGFFEKLKAGLKKTSNAISEHVNEVFSVFVKVDEELFENLEEALSKVADGQATKIIIPSDMQNLASIATSVSEIVKDSK